MKIARFEKRIAAWVFDYLLAMGCSIALFIFFNQKWHLDITASTFVLQCFDVVAYFTLIFLQMLLFGNKTLGMLIFRTRVVHVSGGKIPFSTKLIRSLTMSMLSMCLVNAIYMLVVHSERTIFDKLSDSIVVDKDAW